MERRAAAGGCGTGVFDDDGKNASPCLRSAWGTLVPPRVSDTWRCILVVCACCANGRAQRMRQEACRKEGRKMEPRMEKVRV